MSGTTLFLIDVQVSFHPGGSLAIPTADEDAERIAKLIKASINSSGSTIDRIVVSLDSHHKMHIAHPSFWVDGETGKHHPPPFTLISSSDIKERKWKPRDDLVASKKMKSYVDKAVFSYSENDFQLAKYCEMYAQRLEEGGRFQLCIWPEHCIIGSPGHNVVEVIRDALDAWGEATGGSIEWVHKGQNLLTEMYSALRAEIPVDASTSFNDNLMSYLRESNKLILCGQAMSHCVNFTVRDIVDHWPESERLNLCLLTDCASAVPGFEDAADSFVSDMKAAGLTVCESKDI
eukprot:CAMPEP_0116003462 /NCGR_PEP_ID=MMETSP0321-20121206/68_1 /TAXON_ID=163516 /ORGANISM="Leptocylindrus danicus var. danicus, Strain B650" /LENGTH=289 /DNA_ID=CAMNT_0003471671 /DNA_START=156 /DNA_END=1025 /DNA_ORIENTATION=-